MPSEIENAMKFSNDDTLHVIKSTILSKIDEENLKSFKKFHHSCDESEILLDK